MFGVRQVHFQRGNECDTPPTIAGARIVNYLLEKTRLSGPPRGERNFHVLYQLVSPRCVEACNKGPSAERPESLLAVLPTGQVLRD